MTKTKIPTFDAFMNPVIQALKSLGGSGTIEEINNKASEIAGLSDEQLEVLHNPEKGGQTEIEYRLAWTRTYLKKYGVLENSSRGIWALTPKGRQLDRVTPKTVRRFVQEQKKNGQLWSKTMWTKQTQKYPGKMNSWTPFYKWTRPHLSGWYKDCSANRALFK